MTVLQAIKELQRLCKQGKFRTWSIGGTDELWYTGWLHLKAHHVKRFCRNDLNDTLNEMLKSVEEGKDV
jgi:hypothetical protein